MKTPTPQELALVQEMLGALREELGVHALRGAEGCGFQDRLMRSLAAMVVLHAAAREVAKAIGQTERWIALNAAEVPANMGQGGTRQ